MAGANKLRSSVARPASTSKPQNVLNKPGRKAWVPAKGSNTWHLAGVLLKMPPRQETKASWFLESNKMEKSQRSFPHFLGKTLLSTLLPSCWAQWDFGRKRPFFSALYAWSLSWKNTKSCAALSRFARCMLMASSRRDADTAGHQGPSNKRTSRKLLCQRGILSGRWVKLQKGFLLVEWLWGVILVSWSFYNVFWR